jgi:UDP-2,3-diacylglucosamine hydrolase
MLSLPLLTRRKLAKKGRAISKQKQSKLNQEIMDVTPQEVVSVMQAHGVVKMIHGHTHRPAIHQLQVNKQHAQRIVLGDWYDQGSILQVSKDGLELSTVNF